MASLVNSSNGCRRIEFRIGDRRHKLFLGKVPKKQAQSVKMRIEELVSVARFGHVMSAETLAWVAGVDDDVRGKLERLSLVRASGLNTVTLGELMRQFFATLNVKPGTRTTYEQTRRVLKEFFGEEKTVKEITPLEGDQWRQAMKEKGLAEATISKRVKTARQIFKRAIRWKMLSENPLAEVKAGSQANKSRQFFITVADAERVLKACPDDEWRLLVALSRYGGLRCPSEHLALKWSDVDWKRGRVRVPSCKTEHLEGGDERQIPLFPELRRYLEPVAAKAEAGAEYVISRYRGGKANLRTQFQRIIKRAGVMPWPRLFHNLRSTRQTELEREYESHVVCAWLGNSIQTARAHYLQVTDEDFSRASESVAEERKKRRSTQPQ